MEGVRKVAVGTEVLGCEHKGLFTYGRPSSSPRRCRLFRRARQLERYLEYRKVGGVLPIIAFCLL